MKVDRSKKDSLNENFFNKVIRFPKGLIGLSNEGDFTLSKSAEELFFYLTSVEKNNLSFLMVPVEQVAPKLKIAYSDMELRNLSLTKGEHWDIGAFVLLNIPEDPKLMSVNLKAPIIVNYEENIGLQIVLSDNKLSINEPVFEKLKLSQKSERLEGKNYNRPKDIQL